MSVAFDPLMVWIEAADERLVQTLRVAPSLTTGSPRRAESGERAEIIRTWDDARRRLVLVLVLAPGPKPLPDTPRDFTVRVVPDPPDRARAIRFDGPPLEIPL